ncbi:ketopantoate reductase family protein [Ammoniphilus resinae]|uniref:2-dehydropantoate 2-reductase n=1 Tax=Ammoniphilus resinae TaxID=861532 RepID=A0ABS4GM29_9BACL|nr:2-dehydropantoate 2-reductase [Ammoniphilus resinae]MBP1931306.1 2-dehydropantoate 2-reductase [Ammoniphilus resinae]
MILIVGAGAMGGMLAVRLAKTGEEVQLIDTSEPLVTQINNEGLLLERKGEIEKVYVPATSIPDQLGEVDTVFIYVKGQDTLEAAKLIQQLVTRSTTVVTLQNGWGNGERLAEIFHPEQIVVGLSYDSVKTVELGHLTHTVIGQTYIGPYSDEGEMERADKIGVLLNRAGLQTEVTAGIKTEIWKKLILNAAVLPIAALTRLTTGKLIYQKEFLHQVAEEAVRVAQAKGYSIELDERLNRIDTLLKNGGQSKPSMLQDAEAKRRTEIDFINGAVVRAGREVGVPVPRNEALLALVKGLERGWEP